MTPVPPPRLRQNLPGIDVPKFGSRRARVPDDVGPLGRIEQDKWSVTPSVLESTKGRFTSLIVLVIAALIWNGAVGFLVGSFLGSLFGQSNGTPRGVSIFGSLFMLPFIAIGLVLIGGAIHGFLGLFNPRAVVRCSKTAIAPGDSFEIDWEIPERATRLSKVVVSLRCREEAVYTEGTTTRTDTEQILDITVSESGNVATSRASGSATVTIPREAMHSFADLHNRVVWSLHFEGEIPRWPDIEMEYEIYVVPRTLLHLEGDWS